MISIFACIQCLTKWYPTETPYGIVLMVHLLCLLCKHAPSGKILKRYNKHVCTILKSDKKNNTDEHWHYGWCIDYCKFKQAQQKSVMRMILFSYQLILFVMIVLKFAKMR